MSLNYYKLSFKSTTDGRSFTQEIKTSKVLTSSIVKNFYETRCNVLVVSFAEVTYFDTEMSLPKENLTFGGSFEYQGKTIPVIRKILPLLKDSTFNPLYQSSQIELQNDLKILFGDSFQLKTCRMD